MAIHADTIWGVKTSGSNNNGGGWRDYGGASTDYSEQDSAEIAPSNCSIAGTTVTDDDGGAEFTAAMVGSVVNIAGVGRYQISAYIDTDNVTLESAPGNSGGNTVYVGGAVADPEEIDNNIVRAGNTVWIKAGTYTLASSVIHYQNNTNHYGYNASRGDNPDGDDRPFFDGGASYQFRMASGSVKNLRVSGDVTQVFYATGAVDIRNCYARNTSGADRYAFYCSSTGNYLWECEFVSDGGQAAYVGQQSRMIGLYLHDSNRGILLLALSTITDSIIDDMVNTGIGSSSPQSCLVKDTTINGCDIGIDITSDSKFVVWNCQITNHTTYGVTGSAANIGKLDWNNFYGNGDDLGADVEKGDNTTSVDPDYAGADDFSGVDQTDGYVITNGVG